MSEDAPEVLPEGAVPFVLDPDSSSESGRRNLRTYSIYNVANHKYATYPDSSQLRPPIMAHDKKVDKQGNLDVSQKVPHFLRRYLPVSATDCGR